MEQMRAAVRSHERVVKRSDSRSWLIRHSRPWSTVPDRWSLAQNARWSRNKNRFIPAWVGNTMING